MFDQQSFPTRHGRALALLAMVVIAAGLGAGADRLLLRKPAGFASSSPEDGIRARPGPWGDLYFTPFTISAPDEALPVRALEARGTHWFFPQKTADEVRQVFESAGVSEAGRSALLSAPALRVGSDGADVEPPFAILADMSAGTRVKLYRYLAQIPQNRSEITFIHKDTFEDRIGSSGLSRETLSLFHQLCCEHGDYFVFSGLGALLAQLPAYEEKVHLVKALTRQKTMLFRLHVSPDSDVAALSDYWGKGSYGTDVRTILQSVATVKNGAWIDIAMLLPPLPSSELYFYPIVTDNPLDGPPVVRDCHWTSFNFFRDKPDPTFSEPGHVMQLLRENYYPAAGDPKYGDLVLLTKPDGTAIHSAIYLADDVVFTKNGSTVAYPWMLSTVADLLKQYSFQVADGEKLTVTYFRNYTM